MTAKQKANRERFKKVVAEAKKLRKKNPKLTQAQAVKQAWAIMYSKTGKKVGEYHKDTKSHNVNIRVVSGLPPSFRGKFGSVEFRIVKQYDIYGKINAVLEDIDTKQNFVTITGKDKASDLALQFHKYIAKNDKDFANDFMKKETLKRMTKFFTQLNKDVKEENLKTKSVSKPKNNPKPVKKIKQTGVSSKVYDMRKQAKKPGKRKSAAGNTYYEYRANRSDRGVLLGIGNVINNQNLRAYKDAISRQNYFESELLKQKQAYSNTKERGIKISIKRNIESLKNVIAAIKKEKLLLKKNMK